MYLLSVCLQNTEYFIDPITENDGVNLHIKLHKSNNKQTTILKDLRERERERERERILYYTRQERERDDQQ